MWSLMDSIKEIAEMEPMIDDDWKKVFHTLFTMGESELALKMMIDMALNDEFPVPTLLVWAFEEGKLIS